MQEPTEDDDDEASISIENVGEDPNLNIDGTFSLRRKAAKRSLPWNLIGEELDLVLRPQESEEIRATKKPRLEEARSTHADKF
jgi:hypothetical protein